jgi:hypothetical protein
MFEFEVVTERLTHQRAGSGNWTMSATIPQNHSSFEELFKNVDTVPLVLLAIALTNYEGGANPGKTSVEVCQ